MKNLKEFKDEFRLINGGGDDWAHAMEAWFEATGRLYLRDEEIPMEWEYRPGAGPCDSDSYWHDLFKKAKTSTLWQIANFLFRYCGLLKYCGKSY